MALTDGLIAGYNCDGDAVDFTGITGDATIVGATFTTPGFPLWTQAALFDQTDDYFNIPALGISEDSDPFTIVPWLNFTNVAGSTEFLFVNQSVVANEFSVSIFRRTTGQIDFIIRKNGVWDVNLRSDANLLPSADVWYQPVVTYDGSRTFAGMKLYLAGTHITAVTNQGGAFGASATATDNWLAGGTGGFGSDFGGKGNQFLFYNRGITASEVSQLWNGGAGIDISAEGIIYPSMPARLNGSSPLAIPGTIPGVNSSGVWQTSQ